MKSLYWRNFTVTASIVLLSMLINSLLFTWLSKNYTVDQNRRTLKATASVVAETVAAQSTESDLGAWDIRLMITTVSKSSNVHISICDKDGIVLSCSDEDLLCEHVGKVVPTYVLDNVNTNGIYTVSGTIGGYYSHANTVSVMPIESPETGDTIGYVLAAVENAKMMRFWTPFGTLFVLVGGIVLMVALAASVLVTKKQAAPLRDMAEAAGRLAKGQFDVRVKRSGINEMAELADAFNLMADSLETSENSRRDFVANVSHELKTPMTTIAGFADGILDGTIPREQEDRYLSIIADETRRLSRLVRRMLDLSRLQSVDKAALLNSSFDVSEVARQALLALEEKISDKHLEIIAELPEEAVTVRGEADTIMQVIYNIVDNAVKFATEGGMLRVRVWKQEKKAYVAIADQGETIPPEDLPMVFDRFHKSDRSRSLDREGVGLGLYIVKTIISGYGEEINVTSSNGITEFVFTLTLKQE